MRSTALRAFLEGMPRRARYTSALGEILAGALSRGDGVVVSPSARMLSAAS
jgi:hypothetical protein